MKKTIVIIMVFIFSSGFIQHINGQNLTDLQKLKIEKHVDSIFKEMVIFAESLEYDKLNSGVDDKYNAGFISNGLYFVQFDSLLNFVKTRSKEVTKQRIMVQHKKITVLSENFVLLTADGESVIDLSSGNSISIKFLWSFIYEIINGKLSSQTNHGSKRPGPNFTSYS